jgi:hypothetical protein
MQVNGVYFKHEDIVQILQEKSSQYNYTPVTYSHPQPQPHQSVLMYSHQPALYDNVPIQTMYNYPHLQSYKRSYDDCDKQDNKRLRRDQGERQDHLRSMSAAILADIAPSIRPSVSVLDGIIPSISHEDAYKFLLNKLGWGDDDKYNAHIKKYLAAYEGNDHSHSIMKGEVVQKVYDDGSGISVVVVKKKDTNVFKKKDTNTVKTYLFINLSEYETYRKVLVSDLFNRYLISNIKKSGYGTWCKVVSDGYQGRAPDRHIIKSFTKDIKHEDGYLLCIVTEMKI